MKNPQKYNVFFECKCAIKGSMHTINVIYKYKCMCTKNTSQLFTSVQNAAVRACLFASSYPPTSPHKHCAGPIKPFVPYL